MRTLLLGTGKASVGIGDVMLHTACIRACLQRGNNVLFETTPEVADWLGHPLIMGMVMGLTIVPKDDPYETPNADGGGTFLQRKLRYLRQDEDWLPWLPTATPPRRCGVAVATACSDRWRYLRGGHRRNWGDDVGTYAFYPILNLDHLGAKPSHWVAFDDIPSPFSSPQSIVITIRAMRDCAIYVGVDTGWLHVAVALGIPQIICYAPPSCPEYRHEDWHYPKGVVEYRTLV